MYVLLLGVWSYPAWGVGARVIKLIAKVETSHYFIKRRLCPIWGKSTSYLSYRRLVEGWACFRPKGKNVRALDRTYTLAERNVYLSRAKRIRPLAKGLSLCKCMVLGKYRGIAPEPSPATR